MSLLILDSSEHVDEDDNDGHINCPRNSDGAVDQQRAREGAYDI